MAAIVSNTDKRVSDLRANLIVSLRLSAAGDRRATEPRIPVSIAGVLKSAGSASAVRGTIVDISSGGVRFRSDNADNAIAEGGSVAVEIANIGTVASKVIAKSPGGIHLQFGDVPDEIEQRISDFLRSVEQVDQKFISAAKQAALHITETFEKALGNGDISNEALFDTNYRIVPDTNPVQHLTGFVEFCDRVLPAIQEPMLALDPRVVFCAAVDRNAFLPTHNRKFAQTPRPNDTAWNAANCRNRRNLQRSGRPQCGAHSARASAADIRSGNG